MYVGIDLGGSGTRAALVDADGHLLATGKGGPSGHLGGPAGRRLLVRALDVTLAPIAPLIGSQPCVIHAGTTGLSIPGRRESLFLEFSRRYPTADVRVSNDALIALWGALAGREGVAVLAGTGSIALARTADGREARAGGWGYLLGDEGGGYWLGRQAITAYLRSLEARGTAGRLVDLVQEALGRRVQTVADVIAWLSAGPSHVSRLASLAPLIPQAADGGDAVALEILARAGQAIAELAVSAARQLWPNAMGAARTVACCGGVWAAGRALEAPFAAALAEGLPRATITAPRLPPVAGAVLLGMGAAAAPIRIEVVDRLAAIR